MSQPLDAAVKRGAPVEKVTTFVLDRRAGVDCLLLLYHPYAGIQLPAGTVEAGESAKVAALREAQEETGLEGLVWGGLLGEECEELPATAGIMALSTPVHTRPDEAVYSRVTASLPRGLLVEVVRAEQAFLQVRYAENDRYPHPQFVNFDLTGWVPAGTVASARIRYFAWVNAPGNTPETWTNLDDQHNFTLRWHRVDALPELVAPQAPWLRYLLKK